eukprot:7015219-Alexandrium_andersonii.AAC.1
MGCHWACAGLDMSLRWACNGFAMGFLQWACVQLACNERARVPVSVPVSVLALGLRGNACACMQRARERFCNVLVTGVQCICNGRALGLQWGCSGLEVSFKWTCSGLAMGVQWARARLACGWHAMNVRARARERA